MTEQLQKSSTDNEFDFDPQALKNKYRQERDKRLRTTGNDQYIEVNGDFSHYVDDPYIEPGFSRAPLQDDVEVLVIGGGFGGLLAGARFREAGIKDIRIIEKGGDFGGTWYWNRYPGAACDIESYIYLPLLEELGYIPTEKYTRAAEILNHSHAIARKYDLYADVCFQTQVTGMAWEEECQRWIVTTNRGDRMRAHYVCMANGPLDRPKLPGIPGIDSYNGRSFHTSRWDYDYTGGDSHGNLTGLKDKRVGIIGTGATAIQCIPMVGASAKELYVFQRTPSSVDVRANRPTDSEWAGNLEPGWQKRRMENFNTLISGGIEEQDLVGDGWTEIMRDLLRPGADAADLSPEAIAERMEMLDFKKMEQIRARAEALVDDPATAESLKPYYRQFCKRPCFHDEYLQTFNRDNVALVDTQGKGVERVTEKGVVVDGKEYELDCLIFATGFEVGTDYARRVGYDPIGRDGLSLTQKWAQGAETLHGIYCHGFPNCFIMSVGLQNALVPNFPHGLDELAQSIALVLKHANAQQARTVEVSKDAEDAWVQRILDLTRFSLPFQQECTPGYYNNEGKPDQRNPKDASYGAGGQAFFQELQRWRAAARFEGLEFDGRASG